MGVQGTSTDLGRCAYLNCPFCMEARAFKLVKLDVGFNLFGIKISYDKPVYQLACETCDSSHSVPNNEISAAIAAVELGRRLEQGELSLPDYSRELAKLEISTLAEIDAEGSTWLCEGCSEKNPNNFGECWKCHSPKAGTEGLEVDDEPEHIPLPDKGLRQGSSNPWEAL